MKKGRTILILGNGFDLAHGLPTKYSDFLEFCERVEYIFKFQNDIGIEKVYKKRWLEDWCTNDKIKELLFEAFVQRTFEPKYDQSGTWRNMSVRLKDNHIQEIYDCLTENAWYLYLKELYLKKKMRGVNWIDFEAEISYIISNCDKVAIDLLMSCDELCDEMLANTKYNDKIHIFLIS